ncbi:MAG: BatA domain-containing protein [Planctomycetota bacterium]|nr:BatA domain-containing protein [Planctomycetota bacterium]
MTFLNPYLLFGTLGVSVPIIVHLLNRYHFTEYDWAAMDLLRKAMHIRARQIRLEDLILLLLRCLAVILVTLAIARPTIKTGNVFPGTASRGVIIAIDGSFSMAHRQGIKDRFAMAMQGVHEILDTMEKGDSISIILMGSRARVLLRNQPLDRAQIEAVLQKVEPLYEPLNLERGLDEAQSLLNELKVAHRECFIVTDSQRKTWESISDKARNVLNEMSTLGRLFFVSCATEGADNLAITRFELASGTTRRGTMARYLVEVENFGHEAQENVPVSLNLNDVRIDHRVVRRIQPGESQTVSLFARFDTSGVSRLKAELGREDPLKADNARHAVALVRNALQILVVDGDPSDLPFKSETDYLLTALRPKRGGKASTLTVQRINWLDFQTAQLNRQKFPVVILANVRDVNERLAEAMRQYVKEGGGLAIFLGENVNAEVTNLRMMKDGESLMPAELLKPVGNATGEQEGRFLEIAAPEHPLAMPLRFFSEGLLKSVTYNRYFEVKLYSGSRTVLQLSDGAPLLLEKPYGRGTVILFTSTADRDWGNAVVHPVFPILLHQIVTRLTGREFERPFRVGETIRLPLPEDSKVNTVMVTDPDGNDNRIQVTQRENETHVEFPHSTVPGFYRTNLFDGIARADAAEAPSAGEAGSMRIVMAVNVDDSESDVRSLNTKELGNLFKGVLMQMPQIGQNLKEKIREGRVGRELWKVLLITALIILILEFALARWFISRTVEGDADDVLRRKSAEEILSEGSEAA